MAYSFKGALRSQLSKYGHWPLGETILYRFKTKIPVTKKRGWRVNRWMNSCPWRQTLKSISDLRWWGLTGSCQMNQSCGGLDYKPSIQKEPLLAPHKHTRGSLCALWGSQCIRNKSQLKIQLATWQPPVRDGPYVGFDVFQQLIFWCWVI